MKLNQPLFAVAMLMVGINGRGAPPPTGTSPHQMPRTITTSTNAPKPYPPEAVAKLGYHAFVHGGRIRHLEFKNDGKSIVSVADDGAREWDIGTGEFKRLPNAKPAPDAELISPDHSRIARSRNGTTWVQNVNGSGEPVKMEGGGSFMPWLAFSPDGKRLAGSCDIQEGSVSHSSTRLWDASSGRVLHEFSGSSEAGTFSHDGQRLAVAALPRVVVFDCATGEESLRLPSKRQHVWAIDFSPDGELLATGDDQRIRVWNSRTGQELSSGTGHSLPVEALAFAPDGNTIVTGGLDGRIIFWSWPDAREVRRIENVGSSWGVQTLSISPDGSKIAASAWVNNGDPFYIFDIRTGMRIAAFGKQLPGAGPIVWLANGQDVLTMTGLAQPKSGFAVWNANSGALAQERGPHRNGETAIAFAPGTSDFWCATDSGRIELHSWLNGNKIRTLDDYGRVGGPLRVSCDGRWLAAGNCVWDIDSGKLIRNGADTGPAQSFSPDGRLLALGDEGVVVILELMTHKEIHRFKVDSGKVAAIAFSPDGSVLAASDYNDALVFDMTGEFAHGRLPSRLLSQTALKSLWQAMAGDDSWSAYRAAWRLATAGTGGARFLSERLNPAILDQRRIATLHRMLSYTNFDVRERAARELVDMGVKLQPAEIDALRRPVFAANMTTWNMDHPFDSSSRQFLQPPPPILPLPERLRSSRAILSLEHNPSHEAEYLLEKLSDGAPSAPQTIEAKAAFARRRFQWH
ncbi:MAG: repeat protein [Verrucomicrobiales bacterium]|nr:repeat protein [Verrucomicrobiales bacterium]